MVLNVQSCSLICSPVVLNVQSLIAKGRSASLLLSLVQWRIGPRGDDVSLDLTLPASRILTPGQFDDRPYILVQYIHR